jgi:hypothetical protein
MSEPILIGPADSPSDLRIDLDKLKKAVLERWEDAVIKHDPESHFPLRWDVISEQWYIECILSMEYTLSIQSNNEHIRIETALWYFDFVQSDNLYLYDANRYLTPLHLDKETDKKHIVDWLIET